MAVDSYLSEIQIFAFPYAPKNWAQCNGQTLAINTNQALFSLLGTQFGGNGVTTFNLPDLRGRTPISAGTAPSVSGYTMGQTGGEENHTLTIPEMPTHNHQMVVTSLTADQATPEGNLLANGATNQLFSTTQNNTVLAGNFIAQAGNGQAHNNLQPYIALNFCICLAGIFPSRN